MEHEYEWKYQWFANSGGEDWHRFGEMGLFGVTASSEFGGSDMTYLDQVGIISS